MMNIEALEEKYPFLMKYFKNGIINKNKRIANCLLFYGTDLNAQYALALEIARLLNCTGDKTPTCNCLNCKWLRDNQHPAVLTISKVDNKSQDDDSKSVISIDQARMIKDNLLVASDYHRVFIFCDKDSNGNILGLNTTNFQEPTANALLKTFEEPPANTTFIFLTKNKTDVLSTIISRAQCFYVPSKQVTQRDFSIVKDAMDGYLEIPRNNVLDFYDKIFELTKENEPMEILNQMQNYICELLEHSTDNKGLKIKLIKDINTIEHAKEELNLNMNIQTILENLAFKIILER